MTLLDPVVTFYKLSLVPLPSKVDLPFLSIVSSRFQSSVFIMSKILQRSHNLPSFPRSLSEDTRVIDPSNKLDSPFRSRRPSPFPATMASPGGTNEEDRIAGLLRSMARIYSEALSAPNPRWSSYLPLAREVMAAIDQTSFMARPERREQQIWVLEGLQKLAFKDHDEGGVTDIARWCLQHWLAIVDRSPDNVPALQGMASRSCGSPVHLCLP